MSDLLIRDLPSNTHDELKRRAHQAGMSLQAYVTRILGDHTALPSLDDWLQGLDELPRHPDTSGAATIRAVRDDELP